MITSIKGIDLSFLGTAPRASAARAPIALLDVSIARSRSLTLLARKVRFTISARRRLPTFIIRRLLAAFVLSRGTGVVCLRFCQARVRHAKLQLLGNIFCGRQDLTGPQRVNSSFAFGSALHVA